MNRFKSLLLNTGRCQLLHEPSQAVNKNISKALNRCCSTEVSRTETETNSSVIEQVDEQDQIGEGITKRFNFAMYADRSPVIQRYIDLGVNLFELEKKPAAASYLLTLNFEKIKPYLFFLNDNGVTSEKIGDFITKNPLIFKEDLDDLQVRINYLKSKKFTDEMISTIINKCPKWLSVSVKTIDDRLGFLQQTFALKGDQVREMIVKVPSLALKHRDTIDINLHSLKEELGLDKYQLKKLVVMEPKLLSMDSFDLVSTYEYLTKTMKISPDLIINQPKVLMCRKFRLKQRHKFLESLGRAQYNHLLPGFVSLLSLVQTKDTEFCEKIARTSEKLYYDYLKTL